MIKIAGMSEIHALLVLGMKPDSAPDLPSHMKAGDTAACDEACHAATPRCSCAPCRGHKGTCQEGQLADEEEGCCSSSSDTGSLRDRSIWVHFCPHYNIPLKRAVLITEDFI